MCAGGEVKGVRGRWEVLGEMHEVWGGREEFGGEGGKEFGSRGGSYGGKMGLEVGRSVRGGR